MEQIDIQKSLRHTDKTIIPARGGFIFHRMFFENCDAGPIHKDNTEIIAWAIEDGDVFPVIPGHIIREFSRKDVKACVITPSGRVSVPRVGSYDSFAKWERDSIEEHAATRSRFKARAKVLEQARVHPVAALTAATRAVKQKRAEARKGKIND